MKLLFLGLFFVSSIANADLYKCISGNKPTYQDHPCNGTSRSVLSQKTSTQSMLGCYSVDFPGWETGINNEKFKVTSVGNGVYKMDGIGKASSGDSIPMKDATSDELKAIGDAFNFVAKEGISMKWAEGTPNQKPIGFYRGTTSQGEKITLAFFFLSSGRAKEISCP